MQRAKKKNTLGFLFSRPVGMDNAQGEISSLVLVREMGGDGVETDDLWLDIELSDFPSLEGKVPLPNFGSSVEGWSWSVWVDRVARGSGKDPSVESEAELALETGGEGEIEGFCPWSASCGAVLLDLFIRSERAGEGWKHFSGKESVALWLSGGDRVDNADEADVGCM